MRTIVLKDVLVDDNTDNHALVIDPGVVGHKINKGGNRHYVDGTLAAAP